MSNSSRNNKKGKKRTRAKAGLDKNQSTLKFNANGKLLIKQPKKDKQKKMQHYFFNKMSNNNTNKNVNGNNHAKGGSSSANGTSSLITNSTKKEQMQVNNAKQEIIIIEDENDEDVIKHEITVPLATTKKNNKKNAAPFSILASAFTICAATKGRIEITNALTNAFYNIMKINAMELFPAVCLASDSLPSSFEEQKCNADNFVDNITTSNNKSGDTQQQNQLGVGGSSISKALRQVLGCDRTKLRTHYKKFGDLGDAAEDLASSKGRQALFSKPKPLTIMDIFNALIKISKQSGVGSTGRKEGIIGSLFRRCDISSSKSFGWKSGGSNKNNSNNSSSNSSNSSSSNSSSSSSSNSSSKSKGAPELRFLTRCLLRNMRINASMITIMSSCGRACEQYYNEKQEEEEEDSKSLSSGSKKKHFENNEIDQIVRQTYAIHHDLYSVVEALRIGGIRKMQRICQVSIGIPIDPMLAKPAMSADDILSSIGVNNDGNILCEWKYDGMRAQIHWSRSDTNKSNTNNDNDNEYEFHIFSRHCAETTSRFPEIKRIIENVMIEEKIVHSCILDCEIVAYDPAKNIILPFQKLSTRKRKVDNNDNNNTTMMMMEYHHGSSSTSSFSSSSSNNNGRANNVIVALIVFDIILLNDESLVEKTLEERRYILHDYFNAKQAANNLNLFQFAKSTIVNSKDEQASSKIIDALNTSIKDGCEGLMVKLLSKPTIANNNEEKGKSPSKKKIKMQMISAKYMAGKRSDEWRKLKADYMEGGTLCDSIDVVVIGAWDGNGRKKNWFSPLLVAVYDEDNEEYQSLCRVMSGFNDEMYSMLTARLKENGVLNTKPRDVDTRENCPYWFEPSTSFVIEIRGAELSISPVHRASIGIHHGVSSDEKGLALRFPRFIRLRPDKIVNQCTKSEQISEIFAKQVKS